MILIEGYGNVSKDPELQQSQSSGTKFLRLNVIINNGYGESAKAVLVQYTFFNEDAERIVNAKVKKGSSIHVYGEFDEIGAFVPKGKEELFMFIKCFGKGWSYLNTTKKDQNTGTAATTQGARQQAPAQQPQQVPPQAAATPASQQVPPTPAQQPAQAAPAQQPMYAQQPVYQQAAVPLQAPQAQQPDPVLVVAAAAGVAGYDTTLGETEDLPF